MYWLCITNERNWNVIKKKNIWETKSKSTISKVKKGDKLIIYLKQDVINNGIKPPRIVGIYEVSSEVFEDDSKVLDKFYPYKVKIKPIKIFKELLDFKALILNLNFIKNKKIWYAYLQREMIPLFESDWRLLIEAR